ncbi:hypothetical protein PoB_000031000 [Plakobranchus ocellatus]|uniref:Uncharacterized protein n=1 Tax=Plakobranchus ocellatus TaxID=259542 RepID=A0AAV3XRK5_9GAST|nr:hypothetical protein PoB_000031000 [Plakobranchus ocellatus]
MKHKSIPDVSSEDFHEDELRHGLLVQRETPANMQRLLSDPLYYRLIDQTVMIENFDAQRDYDDKDRRLEYVITEGRSRGRPVACVASLCHLCRQFSYPIPTRMLPADWMVECNA